jgi:hypothetical protein
MADLTGLGVGGTSGGGRLQKGGDLLSAHCDTSDEITLGAPPSAASNSNISGGVAHAQKTDHVWGQLFNLDEQTSIAAPPTGP